MNTIFIVWLLMMVFLVSESGLRKGENAKSYKAGDSDQKTSYRLGMTYGGTILAILLSPILNNYQIGLIIGGMALIWIGIGMMLIGLAIRTWATRVLGQFYTRTL